MIAEVSKLDVFASRRRSNPEQAKLAYEVRFVNFPFKSVIVSPSTKLRINVVNNYQGNQRLPEMSHPSNLPFGQLGTGVERKLGIHLVDASKAW